MNVNTPPRERNDVLLDESDITEIEFAPSGRLYVFGASREFLELLCELGLGDEAASQRLNVLPQSDAPRTQ